MVKPSTICKRDGCDNAAALDGLCKPHWRARDHHRALSIGAARIRHNIPDDHLALAYWREKARDN